PRHVDQLGVRPFVEARLEREVKAVCLPGAASDVAAALTAVPGVLNILRSSLGEGARLRANAD
ncbi:MAG: hypothetical protein ABI661_11315, partial [Gammaproteobacteria bacterium]